MTLDQPVAAYAGVFYEKGGKAEHAKDFQKAIQYYQQALFHNPKHTDSLNRLGHIYYSLGEHQKGISYFLQTSSLVNREWKYWDAIMETGKYYMGKGDYLTAIYYLRRGIHQTKETQTFYYLMRAAQSLNNKPLYERYHSGYMGNY